MLKRISRFLRLAKPRHRSATQPPWTKFLMTQACLSALQASIAPEVRKGHEGIAYLLGRTNGTITLAVAAFRPEAQTSPGSFRVESRAMALCVRIAARNGLQIVAQVHTHPGAAYHSDGDVEGARIRYIGYGSIVLPDYGRRLPSLDGAAVYFFSEPGHWIELDTSEVIVIPGECHG